MVKASIMQTIVPFLLLAAILFSLSACGGTSASASVSYSLPFAPVIFSIDTNGNISVHASPSLVTEVGTFALDVGVAANLQTEDNALLLIVRHKQNGSVVDTVYKIETSQDEVLVVTNGTTSIDVTKSKVFVDASTGNIQSITVKDANSNSVSATPIAAKPTQTPISTASLDISSAANKIISYYNAQGEWAGQYLLRDIQAMTLTQQDSDTIEACAAYEYSQLYTPDITAGTDSRTFSFQLTGLDWQVTAMGGNQSCTPDSNHSTTPPPSPTHTPPSTSQAINIVISYYDTKGEWAGQYVLQSVQSINFEQPVGNYLGACVAYTYANPNTPNQGAGTDNRDFGFHYDNGTWSVFSMGSSGC